MNSIKTHNSYCTSLLLDLHMVYVYKATIPLSVQYMFISSNIKTLLIEGIMGIYGMHTINLLWYLNRMLVIFDKLHLKYNISSYGMTSV